MSPPSQHPNYSADQRSAAPISTGVLTLAGIVIVLTAMKMTSLIIAPMLLAFFLMMIFRPLMAALERRRVPRAFVDSQPQHRGVRALFASGPPLGTTLQKQRPVPVIEHEPPASDEAPSSVAP